MKLFVKFLRMYFTDIDFNKASLTCGCYSDNEKSLEEIQNFWLELLGFPAKCLRERKIDTRPRGTISPRHNRLPYGVCGIVVSRTDIIQHIYWGD